MWVSRIEPLGFRNLEDAPVEFAPGLTVVHGQNGAGKTNLLEALFFALTGRSPRTRREREAIAFGADLARAHHVAVAARRLQHRAGARRLPHVREF